MSTAYWMADDVALAEQTIKTTTYTARKWHGWAKTWVFMAAESIRDDEVMDRILAGYKPQ